jgi:hypothetical protein
MTSVVHSIYYPGVGYRSHRWDGVMVTAVVNHRNTIILRDGSLICELRKDFDLSTPP